MESKRIGRPPTITPEVQQFLQECMRQTPGDFALPDPAWTTMNLTQIIKGRFGIEVTSECIRKHPRKMGLVCHRTLWTFANPNNETHTRNQR